MESLAGKEPYIFGRGVAVNREMMVWNFYNQKAEKHFITSWTGEAFVLSCPHDCFLQGCEVETETDEIEFDGAGMVLKPPSDENSFVRDGVRYVADFEKTSCLSCQAPYKGTDECDTIRPSCLEKNRLDGRGCSWKRSGTHTRPMTLEERVEELERKLEKVG
jgi:hypothetical protein